MNQVCTSNWRNIPITLIDPGRPILNECNRLWVLKKSRRLAGEILQKHVRRKVPSHAVRGFYPRRLLIMMGQHDRSEALFYYFRL